MATSKKSSRLATSSLDELVEFFDTHDMGEYWDQMPEADVEIGAVKHRHMVALDEDLASKVAKIARSRHVSSESLINSLLREKLTEAV